MRVRQMICHTVAVAALGTMCMAQSATGSGTQSTDQQGTDQQRMEQQNNQNQNGTPSSNNRDTFTTEYGHNYNASQNYSEEDKQAQDLKREIEEANRLTKALQNQGGE
jgi:hypothetical protein